MPADQGWFVQLLTQPNKWSCLPTAFAMATGTTPAIMFKFIGHDGSEIIDERFPDPFCRRAFHPQECIRVVYQLGRIAMPFESYPQMRRPNGDIERLKVSTVNKFLRDGSGVLVGSALSGFPHAAAWDHHSQQVYDPNGTIYDVDKFNIDSFWMVR